MWEGFGISAHWMGRIYDYPKKQLEMPGGMEVILRPFPYAMKSRLSEVSHRLLDVVSLPLAFLGEEGFRPVDVQWIVPAPHTFYALSSKSELESRKT